MTDEAEPSFHIEPKHVKNYIGFDFTKDSMNLDITVSADNIKDLKDLFDHTIETWRKEFKK